MNKKINVFAVASFITLSSSLAAKEQTCEASYTPEHKYYRFSTDGTVTDTRTGLTWQRCLVGQTHNDAGTPDNFTDDHCDGIPIEFDWDRGVNYVHYVQGYRLPTYPELETLVVKACKTPAIDLAVFPDSPFKGLQMTSEDYHYEKHDSAHYYISSSLYSGTKQYMHKNIRGYLRLVKE
ncbi:hypothetical protein GCM10023116_25780 [Kistimonas scapharcae]|uniref:Lcl C-terminal domain-containing protein n=1 Tax=Kistimonas scapharcae TaxID=1036133 RepID=A0ABP8V2H1_9GAMM